MYAAVAYMHIHITRMVCYRMINARIMWYLIYWYVLGHPCWAQYVHYLCLVFNLCLVLGAL